MHTIRRPNMAWAMFFLCLVAVSVSATPVELMQNGSFEEVTAQGRPAGFAFGYVSGNAEIVSDNAQARSGEWSVRITSDGNERPALGKYVQLEGGRAYRFTVWYQASEGIQPKNIRPRIMAYNASPHNEANKTAWQMSWLHEPLDEATKPSLAGPNFHLEPQAETYDPSNWARLTVDFTVPPEVKTILIQIFNQFGPGSLWIDDLSVQQLPAGYEKVSVSAEDSSGLHAEILETLRRQHPRVMATVEDFARIRRLVQEDTLMRRWYASLTFSADKIVLEPVSEYVIPDGKRLLATSRQVLDRVETLAMAYRIEANERYLERLWQELQAAANFPDWNPSHFLDTAEMTRAFAIAYDWLYDVWSQQQRQILREAIIDKGLDSALMYYHGKAPAGWQGGHNWTESNWCFVVNGGIAMGALALADEVPEMAEEILQTGLHWVRQAIARFSPDGGWDEGTGYWHYSIRYLISYMCALETALGTDFGLAQTPGIDQTGFFPVYLTNNKDETFNFGDTGTEAPRASELLWLADRFNQPALAGWFLHTGGGSAAKNLLWYRPGLGEDSAFDSLALDKHFSGVEVASFRSAWLQPEGVFVAFKGGTVNRGHGQLDVGNFVLDALSVRWAEQTGADNYNLPGYSNRGSGQRWTYYRIRAEGQNTLVINPGAGPDQNLAANAPIIHLASRPNEAVGIIDMSSAYAPHARARRGIALFDNRRQVMIQDEIEADDPAELWWFMHTKAGVHIDTDGRTATLQRNGRQLMVRILSPSDACFEILAAEPLPGSPNPEGQNPNTGFRKLAIHLQDVIDTTLAVQFLPLNDAETVTIQPAVVPLSEWVAETDIWQLFPRMILDMDSPQASERVAGTVPVKLRLETPEEIKVSGVAVTFADRLIYEGIDVPEELLVDARPLTDGSHALSVRIALEDGGDVFREFPLRVENRWHMLDSFQPPIAGWLGTFDLSETFAASDGWGYSTGQKDEYFEDNDRRVRTGPGTEYLIWESSNLERYELSVYASTANIEEILRIDISSDGDIWHEHPYEVSVKDKNSQGRFHLVVTGRLPENTADWLRITLKQSDLPHEEIQLGELQLWGRNW